MYSQKEDFSMLLLIYEAKRIFFKIVISATYFLKKYPTIIWTHQPSNDLS